MVRRDLAQKAMEKELLGKEVPVYNKDRYACRCLQKTDLDNTDGKQIRAADICRHSFKCDKVGPLQRFTAQRSVMYIPEESWSQNSRNRLWRASTAVNSTFVDILVRTALTRRAGRNSRCSRADTDTVTLVHRIDGPTVPLQAPLRKENNYCGLELEFEYQR